MKILSARQIRLADQHTLVEQQLDSWQLMERAATRLSQRLVPHLLRSEDSRGLIVCGSGNNGGDGLVVARQLHEQGLSVEVLLVPTGEASAVFLRNQALLPATLPQHAVADVSLDDLASRFTWVLDALLGTGLNKPVTGALAQLIAFLNEQPWPIYSVDIPSGLFADSHTPGEAVVRARHTFTLQLPKLSFLMPSYARFVGTWEVIDIGLSEAFIEHEPSPWWFTEAREVANYIKARARFAHKGHFGRALVIGGSYGKIGAVALAAKAALRAGAGLVSAYTPKCGYNPLQAAVPEVMVEVDENKKVITRDPAIGAFHAVGIGPGLGTDTKTAEALQILLQRAMSPLVLDADALNILAENPAWLSQLPAESILTPHLKEFERLVGQSANDFEAMEKLGSLARNFHVYVVLKGAYSCIATPDGAFYFNSSGNPGMATGGSGDVLTGILTSLMAQGYAPLDACLLGVYLHGLAGDLASERVGQEALIASDIIDHIGSAYKYLHALAG